MDKILAGILIVAGFVAIVCLVVPVFWFFMYGVIHTVIRWIAMFWGADLPASYYHVATIAALILGISRIQFGNKD